MTLHSTVQRVLDLGLVAILRAERGERLPAVARAIRDGGIDVIEVTLTVPDALEIIRTIRRELGPDVLLGAGTVLDPESARLAMLAGAEFIVTPTVNRDVVTTCRRYGTPCLMGAYTPTEILTAWQAGADLIKVFPAEIGGPDYLKAMDSTGTNGITQGLPPVKPYG